MARLLGSKQGIVGHSSVIFGQGKPLVGQH